MQWKIGETDRKLLLCSTFLFRIDTKWPKKKTSFDTLPIYLHNYVESYAGYINDPFIDVFFHWMELHFAGRFLLSFRLHLMVMGHWINYLSMLWKKLLWNPEKPVAKITFHPILFKCLRSIFLIDAKGNFVMTIGWICRWRCCQLSHLIIISWESFFFSLVKYAKKKLYSDRYIRFNYYIINKFPTLSWCWWSDAIESL